MNAITTSQRFGEQIKKGVSHPLKTRRQSEILGEKKDRTKSFSAVRTSGLSSMNDTRYALFFSRVWDFFARPRLDYNAEVSRKSTILIQQVSFVTKVPLTP